MQSNENFEQQSEGYERVHNRRSSRQGRSRLVRLHDRLRFSLDHVRSRGDLWLLLHSGAPFVVVRNQPFFSEALEVTPRGWDVFSTIGRELARSPGIYSLVAGHVGACGVSDDEGWTGCHEAWKQARGVEMVLVEAGADRDRVLSVGMWRWDRELEKKVLHECSLGGPFVVTICFSAKRDELGDPARKRIYRD